MLRDEEVCTYACTNVRSSRNDTSNKRHRNTNFGPHVHVEKVMCVLIVIHIVNLLNLVFNGKDSNRVHCEVHT